MTPAAACTWREDEDTGSWDTACGNKYTLIDGSPSENRMAFCCYCGGKLTERAAPYYPDSEDSDNDKRWLRVHGKH